MATLASTSINEVLMIRGYSDHAANERTFLAWVRIGIAVIAFGFVVEKFNLFVLAMASASAPDAGHRLLAKRLSGPFGRYDGLALIVVGLALIVVAATRFVWTGWRLDDQESHSAGSMRAELMLSTGLAVIVAGFGAFLVLA
jgi:putative membrane protein